MSDVEMPTAQEEPETDINEEIKDKGAQDRAAVQAPSSQHDNQEPNSAPDAEAQDQTDVDAENIADGDTEVELAADVQADGEADDPASDPLQQDSDKPTPTAHDRGSYKSYRKKYRKMRMRFEEVMEEANTNFLRECFKWDMAKRLKEQNDQLLDIITDLILESRSSAGEDPAAIIDRRFNLSNLEKDILHTPYNLPDDFVIPDDLADLDIPNADDNLMDSKPSKDGPLPPLKNSTYCDYDPTYATPPSYLTIEHEEAYLAELDASLSAVPPTDRLPTGVETVNPRPPPFKRVQLTEEDFAMRNPISVHNWLRRHHPQIFEPPKDREKMREERETREALEAAMPPKSKYVRKEKKEDKVISKQDQPFEGLDDEIGFDPTVDPPALGSARGKKRKDDEAYRPKGGHSRGGKRKRGHDEGEGRGRMGKRTKAAAEDS